MYGNLTLRNYLVKYYLNFTYYYSTYLIYSISLQCMAT